MKRFKYLYFTNALNKPYFNYWFLKKLKVKEEDDGNYLSEPPTPYKDGDITWSWNKMTASGDGERITVSSGSSNMTDVLALKKNIVTGESYTFSVAETLPSKRSIWIILSNEGGDSEKQTIRSGTSSSVFTSNNDYTHFRLYLQARRGEIIDNTFEDIKIEKAA